MSKGGNRHWKFTTTYYHPIKSHVTKKNKKKKAKINLCSVKTLCKSGAVGTYGSEIQEIILANGLTLTINE